MRKLKLQMDDYINGYVGGTNGVETTGWPTWNPWCWIYNVSDFAAWYLRHSLLDGKTAENIIKYWEHEAKTKSLLIHLQKMAALQSCFSLKRSTNQPGIIPLWQKSSEQLPTKSKIGKRYSCVWRCRFCFVTGKGRTRDEYHLIVNQRYG